MLLNVYFFFSSRRRHTRWNCDWSSDVCSSDLVTLAAAEATYLAWLDCREARIPGGDPFTFFLERAKVALNDGRLFGPGGDGFVRLNFGVPRSLLAEGLQRMARAL